MKKCENKEYCENKKHKETEYRYYYTPNGNDYEYIRCVVCKKEVVDKSPLMFKWVKNIIKRLLKR
jgi:hypothetical protein